MTTYTIQVTIHDEKDGDRDRVVDKAMTILADFRLEDRNVSVYVDKNVKTIPKRE